MVFAVRMILQLSLVVVAGLACFFFQRELFSAHDSVDVDSVDVGRRSLASSESESPRFNPMKPMVNYPPIFASDFNDKDCNGKDYAELKNLYERDGGVVFKSCSLRSEVLDEAGDFTRNIVGVGRAQDAHKSEASVLQVAIDPHTLEFLSYLNDRKAFPFQTLNFPVGTQQAIHSDVVHFDTLPTRGLMTAAWVAFEDIHPDSGPLRWYPKSHKLGVWDIDELGIRGKFGDRVHLTRDPIYEFYEREVQATIDRLRLPSEVALLRRGESFLWAASLLHGGSAVHDKSKSRLSQVTHYWLEGADKYWTPLVSHPGADIYQLRCAQPTCHSSLHTDCAALGLQWFMQQHQMTYARPKNLMHQCVENMKQYDVHNHGQHEFL
ncbi:hypothetical protein B484DRAFT_465072 [Ochromonadaceae sp. CCMP2298]|nr:hypothetical protein B484DRAFT_465072 [Ochromonadaceae sp. CCMP2298]